MQAVATGEIHDVHQWRYAFVLPVSARSTAVKTPVIWHPDLLVIEQTIQVNIFAMSDLHPHLKYLYPAALARISPCSVPASSTF